MKAVEKIMVPTDLSEGSRCAIAYAAWVAAENHGQLLVMHVANEFAAWELHDDAFGYAGTWPLDRVLNEAALELNRFLDSHSAALNRVPVLHKRVLFGSVPDQIIALAREEKTDLIVLSPCRRRRWQSLLAPGITERVTRTSPCPVLSLVPFSPSEKWRGKLSPVVFGWPRPKVEAV
jgi:nucleotide-binding universal stress UspA family protein